MKKNLTRQEHLRKTTDIRGLFGSARRVDDRGVRLFYRENGSGSNRIAIIVGRRCGGAVRRNREKRITREAYRDLKPGLQKGHDLLFIIDRFGQGFWQRRSALSRLFEQAKLNA